MGLAKILQETANFQTMIVGTPHYMSPEQIRGAEVDARSDLYCLGATMYELGTGSVPYPKGDAGYHHIHSPVPDPLQLRPDFPVALAGILMKCMAKEPGGRYRTASEVLTALQEARSKL
jgi:serine/threonine protein kinase